MLVVEVGTTCWCQILGPDELLQLLVTMGVKQIGGQEKLMQPGVASPYIFNTLYIVILFFFTTLEVGTGCCSFFFNSPHPCQVHIAIIAICRFPLISASALPYIQSMQQREM